jgi:hypothetical protein
LFPKYVNFVIIGKSQIYCLYCDLADHV